MNDRNDTSPPAGTDTRSAAFDPANWTESKPPEEIEAEVARTRARLAASLDQLEQRLAPKRLIESGLEVFKGSVTRTLEPAPQPPSLGREAVPPREGSRPLALLAIALAWLAVEHLSRRRAAPRPAPVRHREAAMAYEPAEPAYARLKPAADAAADTAAPGRDDARESRPVVPVATAIDRA